MPIKEWLNKKLPNIVSSLEESMKNDYHMSLNHCIGKTGRQEIYDILDAFLAVLFPGSFRINRTTVQDMGFIIDDSLRHASISLFTYLDDLFCGEKIEEPNQKAFEVVSKLITDLPVIRKHLVKDIFAAREGDPAASSIDEIILSYPFVDALATYRLAHNLYQQKVPIIPRIMTERAHSRTGIDIHPGAAIAPGFFIDHGTGVVIGETCTIGENVKLYQGVTLGATSPFDKNGEPRRKQKRHPDIEDNVIIYANATILGGRTVIGEGSIIGGNTWITSSIPPNSLVFRDQNFTIKTKQKG